MKQPANKKPLSWVRLFLLVPVVGWVLMFIVLPHLQLLWLSFHDVLNPDQGMYFGNYSDFFAERIYWAVFLRTALYSIATTLLTLIIVYPVAYYLAKIIRGTRRLFLILFLLLPFWVSELIRTYSWMAILREKGVLNWLLLKTGVLSHPVEFLYNDYAILLGLTYGGLLFMLLPVYSSLVKLDDNLIEAAYDLGASKWNVFWKVILPNTLPGVTSGSIMVFMLTLGNYSIPTLMGGKNSMYFTEIIYNYFMVAWDWNKGSAFGFLLLLLSSFLVWLGLKLTKQKLSEVID
ncbi:spermidine/putrescine transport system permease protein [Desulfotomaculum arcticum]|uniref:Spermidine/putrescine transport system permease protein n=1 Tax=Desulfotruncus arcticus DSM 17038 TaxID=1121424 RepID=A0A1I2VVN1_9FIRM|nr:ABC transporter permease [Desulfotruncus arcticus]SFG93160.1 spermidine/putrescine transport system permease protein [Desulfotomaculum arcticum] [Desulfotruncus arcticus DSM 17038]